MSKTEIVVFLEKAKEQEPIKTFFTLFNNFKFDLQQLPFFNPKPKQNNKNKNKTLVVSDGNTVQQKKEEDDVSKPKLVWFPKTQVVASPPLEAQPEPLESSNNTSNPLILWQVGALGAFFISKWAWARWNERKGQGRSPNDGEGRPSDDAPQSSDNE
ncbi:hypothetical protein TanjilG_17644 [Lupinus angustifolius]|uniref:Uncharacterized protein n=1 Tax=Lupinus angustifolius TaxID=3871 RepID=A0A1J7IE87_LUPAN|nr:PREDICTED: uncharacterized protein LOC109346073 [Lupinus angustifolius]OIW13201.1 hypothetical protein TanjilG_17644 [Lupinus angustifolius]